MPTCVHALRPPDLGVAVVGYFAVWPTVVGTEESGECEGSWLLRTQRAAVVSSCSIVCGLR